MSSAPPQLIADRYRIVEPLGQGGMGRVWKARDEVLHRDVAIKELVPPPGLTDDERREMRERSLREARAIARLNHANVVRVFDVLRTDGDPWIVMEYVPSRSLQDVLASDGPVSPTRAAEIGLGVLGALKSAHKAGVMHRDVKPGNVLLGDEGRVVLTDFGLATVPGDPNVTRTGLVLGSPAYIAPERAKDGTAGPEGDLWSLGATLYAAVEGQSPFARPSAIATLAALATEPPPASRRAGPLKAVLNGLLRKDPAARITAEAAEKLLRRASGRRRSAGRSLLDGVRRPGPNGPREPGEPRTRLVPLPAPRPAPEQSAAAAPPPPVAPPAAETTMLPPPPATETETETTKLPAQAATETTKLPTPPASETTKLPPPTSTETETETEASTSAAAVESPPADSAVRSETAAADAAHSETAGTVPAQPGAAGADAAHSETAGSAPAQPETPVVPEPGVVVVPGEVVPDESESAADDEPEPAVAPTAVPPKVDSSPTKLDTAEAQPVGRAAVPAEQETGYDDERPGRGPLAAVGADNRKLWLIGGLVVLLLIALAVIVPMANDGGSDEDGGGNPAANPTGQPADTPPPAATSAPPTAAPTTAGPTQPSATATGQPGSPLPAGWKLHKDPTGFSVPVPEGWTVSREKTGSAADEVRVWFRDPAGPGQMLIDQTNRPEPDPVADWKSKEAHRRQNTNNYQRVGQIRAVDYWDKCADWEWLETVDGVRVHVRNRGFVTAPDKAYAIRWDTAADEWDENLPNFQIIADGFRPVRS